MKWRNATVSSNLLLELKIENLFVAQTGTGQGVVFEPRMLNSNGSSCTTAVERTPSSIIDSRRVLDFFSFSILTNVFLNRSFEEVNHDCFPIYNESLAEQLGGKQAL